MDQRKKRIVVVGISLFIIASIISIVYFFIIPKLPSTQHSDKTVIIDNYANYTKHISSDSFGNLGNYLYRFIKNPSKGVYHASITDGSYTYDSKSWFSKFEVAVKDSDIIWNISLQTTRDGAINGDIGITCKSGTSCLTLEGTMNTKTNLQDLLPLNSSDYIISIEKKNYKGLSIIYYDKEGVGKTKALDKIKSLGFKPEDYKITYYYGGH